MRILHISDLNCGDASKTLKAIWVGPYAALCKFPEPEQRFDLIVVSGDLALTAKPFEYDELLEFTHHNLLPLLRDPTNRRRVIFVPGNHDVDWSADLGRSLRISDMLSRPGGPEQIARLLARYRDDPARSGVRQIVSKYGHIEWLLLDESSHAARFAGVQRFLDAFYQDTLTDPHRKFDLGAAHEGLDWSAHIFPDEHVAVYGFNSCFLNDRYWTGAAISRESIANATAHAAEHAEGSLLMAVWHHGINHDGTYPGYLNQADLGALIIAGFQVGFHGHLHRAAAQQLSWLTHRFALIGTGSLGANQNHRPDAVGKQFAIAQTYPDQVQVHVYESTGDFPNYLRRPQKTFTLRHHHEREQAQLSNAGEQDVSEGERENLHLRPSLRESVIRIPTSQRYRLSILHISDLHARSKVVDELPEKTRKSRQEQVRREAASRARVLGNEWANNLRILYPNNEQPDLVCFTGDVADWGLASEYAKATEFVEELVRVLPIKRSKIYVVPGNHDVQRHVSPAEWERLRQLLATDTRATSEWLAGGKPPRAVAATDADAVMQRTAAFWHWVEHGLSRQELLPTRHAHGRLGYHHVPTFSHLPFDVHVIGFDSAWLAGDDHDQGKLWVTEHQPDMLLHDEHGHAWEGFRLVLVHHPLEDLAQPDVGPVRRKLARVADLLLHGHQHAPVASSLVDLDGDVLRVLAAGCLYEGAEGDAWKNGCQRIDVVLNEQGRPLQAEIHFRSWSSRGHWHSDSSLYRGLRDGRLVWDAWGRGQSTTSGDVPTKLKRSSTKDPKHRSSPSDANAEASPVAAQLERSYARREELLLGGEDTKLIEQEILELRRAMRRGPRLHPGEYLGDGRFRLVEVIGRGGFALVWKAYDVKDRRLVAVKVLHGEFAQELSHRERLFRGARRMAELRHPNVAQVLVSEGEDEGFRYFVMEFASAGDLYRAVTDGKLDRDRALEVIDLVADALALAHKSGLVHRDVKPENILLREDGSPALSDFDLVQAQDTTGGTRSAAMGTIAYAAPEQSEDASQVDLRADIYGLGMTAVFCLYGKRLPSTAIYNRDVFMSELGCTAGVREALRRAVALNRDERFESMTSFRKALAEARRNARGG